jgi:hypothetical protein
MICLQISALIDIQYTLHKAVTARTTLSNVSGSGTSRIEVLNDPHLIDTTIVARIHSDVRKSTLLFSSFSSSFAEVRLSSTGRSSGLSC